MNSCACTWFKYQFQDARLKKWFAIVYICIHSYGQADIRGVLVAQGDRLKTLEVFGPIATLLGAACAYTVLPMSGLAGEGWKVPSIYTDLGGPLDGGSSLHFHLGPERGRMARLIITNVNVRVAFSSGRGPVYNFAFAHIHIYVPSSPRHRPVGRRPRRSRRRSWGATSAESSATSLWVRRSGSHPPSRRRASPPTPSYAPSTSPSRGSPGACRRTSRETSGPRCATLAVLRPVALPKES